MTYCEYAKTILLALLAEIEVLGEQVATDVPPDLAESGIAYQPAAWLGREWLTAAERKAFSRAADRLEGLGFVKRFTERSRDRVTHLRLTADGLRFALGLAGTSADRQNIARGLRATAWGFESLDARELDFVNAEVDGFDGLGKRSRSPG